EEADPECPGRRLRLDGERGGEEPTRHRADERPTAVHRVTSSARARSDGEMTRPSALAVLRLMRSSNFVGCSTGRSAGLAPLRIRSTYQAPRRNMSDWFGA